MGMLDIQRNHATMFNIRLGEKIKTRNGKDAPSRLQDKMRVTSPNRDIVDAFVAVYGGESVKWDNQGKTEWQSYLPAAIRIMLLPGQSMTQWWELYKGGTCDRRCEGAGGTEKLSGKPCMCSADVEVRMADRNQCSPMTRLNFLCPDVETLGAGSLVTHGRIAAETLPSEVAKAEIALKAGQPVPALLRTVQRIGKERQYVVPQIEITGASYYGLASGQAPAMGEISHVEPQTREISSGAQDKPKANEPASLPAAPSDDPPLANQALREAIRKQAKTKGLSDDDLENLSLDTTSKYIEEPEFSVDDGNALLTAIRRK